jgi:hypothetical protein
MYGKAIQFLVAQSSLDIVYWILKDILGEGEGWWGRSYKLAFLYKLQLQYKDL